MFAVYVINLYHNDNPEGPIEVVLNRVPTMELCNYKMHMIQEPHNAFITFLQAQVAMDNYLPQVHSALRGFYIIKDVPFRDYILDITQNKKWNALIYNMLWEWEEFWEPYSTVLQRERIKI